MENNCTTVLGKSEYVDIDTESNRTELKLNIGSAIYQMCDMSQDNLFKSQLTHLKKAKTKTRAGSQ